MEPGWVITEGSGNPRSLASPAPNNVVSLRRSGRAAGPVLRQSGRAAGPVLPSAEQVSAEVRRRTELALARGYGDNPTFLQGLEAAGGGPDADDGELQASRALRRARGLGTDFGF